MADLRSADVDKFWAILIKMDALTQGFWIVDLVEKIGHRFRIIWYSIIVVDIDQGGCVELTRGRCKTLWGRLGIDELDLHTTKAYNQPRPPPSVDIAIIAHITFLYVYVMLCAFQHHISWLFILYLYFRRLDGKDQLQYSWVQNASRWTMTLYLYWPL